MISKWIFLVVLLTYFKGIQVRGEQEIPVEVTIQNSADKYSGLVKIKCRFPIELDRFGSVWWKINNDIIFFQEKGREGSKLGNLGEMIMDHGYVLAETPGGMSEHHIIVDVNLCYDGWIFECQTTTNDEHEGKGQAVLKLKEPEISMNICDSLLMGNCSNMAENATHTISCAVKGARHEPNITIVVSDDVKPDDLIDVEKDAVNCYHAAEEKVDVALDRKSYYDVTCMVQDGDKMYKVTKGIGEGRNSASSSYFHGVLAAILIFGLHL